MPPVRPVIILTGASRGLGLAVLRLLLSTHGARVATLSRSYPAELKAVSDEFGEDRVLVVQGDVGKPEDNEAVVRRTMDRWGRLDGLVMNAGSLDPVGESTRTQISHWSYSHRIHYPALSLSHVLALMTPNLGKLADVPIAQLIPSVQINLLSALYLLQPALPHLRRKSADGQGGLGRVVFVSSGASATGYQAWGMYSMAKAGMNSLCRTLAAEEAEEGVITWSVRPGLVDVSGSRSLRAQIPAITRAVRATSEACADPCRLL
jgi:NAD(P)-dependent dehydrogenase (short-subunit alcohol dehydrogenase family)